MSDYLSEDLIQEILYKLPIKSLLRCTSLCKSWNSLIKSPTFIFKHLQHTISSTDRQNLFLLRLCSREREEQYSLRLDNQDFNEHMQLHFPFKSSEIIFSCHRFLQWLNLPCKYFPKSYSILHSLESIDTKIRDCQT